MSDSWKPVRDRERSVLTLRQMDVALRAIAGRTNRQIAAELGAVYHRTGVADRNGLAEWHERTGGMAAYQVLVPSDLLSDVFVATRRLTAESAPIWAEAGVPGVLAVPAATLAALAEAVEALARRAGGRPPPRNPAARHD